MMLTRTEIFREIGKGSILIEPFRKECLGTNSYDVHLGKYLTTYSQHTLDARKDNEIIEEKIPSEGIVLIPGTIYLGVTEEYTETHNHVPFLVGKSCVDRLGISIQSSGGKGDIGFCNTWTLKISVIQPVRVYSGMPIAQLIYFSLLGEIELPYYKNKEAMYSKRTMKPVASLLWKMQWEEN